MCSNECFEKTTAPKDIGGNLSPVNASAIASDTCRNLAQADGRIKLNLLGVTVKNLKLQKITLPESIPLAVPQECSSFFYITLKTKQYLPETNRFVESGVVVKKRRDMDSVFEDVPKGKQKVEILRELEDNEIPIYYPKAAYGLKAAEQSSQVSKN